MTSGRLVPTGISVFALALAGGWFFAPYITPEPVEIVEVGGPFESSSFYDAAFGRTSPGGPQESVAGILVNHHLLAPELIIDALSFGATDKPVTVVLIAPDHFNAGAAPITTGYVRFNTPYGSIEPDVKVIKRLTRDDFVMAQEEPFEQEHGIFNITAFIKRLMPNATIVPVIVKDSVQPDAFIEAAGVIADIKGRVLVVGSFDFTHHATMEEAESNDKHSVSILQALDHGRVDEIAVDSHAGLELMMRAVLLRGVKNFELLDSTNSARWMEVYDQTDVTSYITGLFIN